MCLFAYYHCVTCEAYKFTFILINNLREIDVYQVLNTLRIYPRDTTWGFTTNSIERMNNF
ncbi:hypothetical protein VCRA2123O444_320004 [Vibrio crassostreae]|nr:hypothetical protein VCRA2118O429_250048 [Vibrio crassostreae]CAK1941207.1 hypothetical protein VCRA2119O432_260027 [Vibrio crassostreae]CAK1942310.1 hypothetical protein VCRA2114O423_260026 [Vibrio crassostreae]CAK1943818.1 hypothetical protein VCRA2113O411_260026 [Vibrio crassostreae]CAK1944068.1 hypothetical protein VCRA2113O412_260048 [Vibrio crassostreae]